MFATTVHRSNKVLNSFVTDNTVRHFCLLVSFVGLYTHSLICFTQVFILFIYTCNRHASLLVKSLNDSLIYEVLL